MEDRIIRPELNRSKRLNALGWAEEIFFRRLYAIADDYGIFELNFDVLAAYLYPLKRLEVSAEDIKKWWQACLNEALVSQYEANGQVYGVILNFQQQAKKPSIYPMPPADSDLVLYRSTKKINKPVVGFCLKSDWDNSSEILSSEFIIDCGSDEVKKEKRKTGKKKNQMKEDVALTDAHKELMPAAKRIRSKHPRVKKPFETDAAIIKAILRKVEQGLTEEEAIKFIEKATEMYAAITSRWPVGDRRYIVSTPKWYERGDYEESPEFWYRH